MPTQKVPWFPESSCHITARGNRRNDIFRDGEDFQYYLVLIEEALEYFKYDGYKIICYCLMDNHVHILMETKDSNQKNSSVSLQPFSGSTPGV